MHARAIAERSVRTGARRSFWRHFAEMVVAMFVSMAVFGAAVSGVFALLGHGDVLHLPALRGFLMTGYMVLGMALWMRYRGHPWAPVAEMSVAMAIPYAVLLGPFAAGLVDEAVFLGAMHVLMLPLMYATMIHRRAEYEMHHQRRHRPLAVFNRSVANPLTRRFADRLRPFGLVRHRGRVTGGRYETPVMAYATPGGLAIALVYGRGADWVRNVIAAGEVQIERRSEARAYAHARLATRDEALGLLPASARPFLRAVRVRDFLLVSASDRSAEAATASKEARR